jgi:hypothetical protein
MTTQWVVTTATEKVTLDQNRSGEATFTVTNQGTKVSRAVFDIRTGDNVEESWFTVDDPQRPIRPGATVPYLVKIHPGPTVAPGSYEFEARVTPPDAPPEESFVLSRRVLIEVPAPPAPAKKKFPWWIVVAAALLAIVIGVVTWLVWPKSDTTATPEPSPSPVTSAEPVVYVAVPKIEGQSLDNARKLLTDAGLRLGTVNYRFGGGTGGVVRQQVPATYRIPKGSAVDVEIIAPAIRPVITAPGNNVTIAKGQWPTLSWSTTDPYTTRWAVYMQLDTCTRATAGGPEPCGFQAGDPPIIVTDKTFRIPEPKFDFTVKATGSRHSGWVQVYVHPLDSSGQLFEPAVVKFFVEH